MKVVSWEEFRETWRPERPLAATVGVFDGLHIGHRSLIRRVLAKAPSSTPAVFTFAENPKRILRPSSYHGDLASLEQKLEGFESLGLELAVLIDFSGNFSKLAGRDFLSLLRDRGGLSYLAVGSNFRCGHRLDTDAAAIVEFYSSRGVAAEIVEPLEWNGHPVSSSRVRSAVLDGRLEDAAAMLGRPYELDLRRAEALESGDGFASFLLPAGRAAPPEGRYVAEARGSGLRAETILELGEGRVLFGTAAGQRPESVAFIKLTKEL